MAALQKELDGIYQEHVEFLDLLKDAMRSKDSRTADCIRMIKTKHMERRTAAGFKGPLDDALWLDVIATYQKQLRKIQTVLVAPTIVWARPLADLLLGSGYARSADVLAALAPYTFMTGFAPLVSLSVNYLGEARRRVPIAIITLLLSAGLDVWLIQDIGLIGSAISSDISYAFYVGGHLWICKRLLDLPLRPVARDLARALLAAAAMSGVMAAFGTRHLGAGEIVVGAVAGIAAYIAVLLVTRAVTVGELRAARDVVARRFRGGRDGSAVDQAALEVTEEAAGGIPVEEGVAVAQGHEQPAVEGHGSERGA